MSNFKVIAVPITPSAQSMPGRKGKRMLGKIEKYLKKDAGPLLVRDMEKTVAGWRGKPSFVFVYSELFGTQMQIKVFPKGRHTLKWKRISQGTGPRVITAKNPGGLMVFPQDYIPKTTASGRYGGPGRKYGPTVRKRSVVHEIEPREFSAIIVDNREPKLVSDITKIVRKA